MSETRRPTLEDIEDLRDEFPQNGPLGKPEVRTDETLTTEVRRLHILAAHRLSVMTEYKREIGRLTRAADGPQ